MKKNIAIIGGGAAGSFSGWLLSKVHNVTIFESESNLGGHCHTERLEIDNKKLYVDLGTELFSEKNAPNLCAALNHFEIKTFVTPLSFGAMYGNQNNYWSNNQFITQSDLFKAIIDECNKFHMDMHKIIMHGHKEIKNMTIGDFFSKNYYTDDFKYKALMPLLSNVSNGFLEHSLIICAIMFCMGFLSFFHPTNYRKAENGLGSCFLAIQRELGDSVYLNSKVEKIQRKKGKFIVNFNLKEKEFDEIVFATHADIALSLIENPTDLQKKILGCFEYSTIESVLHSDSKILAPNISNRCYREFKSINGFDGSLTRVYNQLYQYSDIKTHILVTFNPLEHIESGLIYAKKFWKMPKITRFDMANKKKLSKIQGVNSYWFCGLDTIFSGIEGSILSGFAVAESLGAKYPFSKDPYAKIQFDLAKNIMGLGKLHDKLWSSVDSVIYEIANRLRLNTGQMSKNLLEIYS